MTARQQQDTDLVRRENGEVMVLLTGYLDMDIRYKIYRRWSIDPEFLALRDSIAGVSGLNEERLWNVFTQAKQSLNLPGEFYECGVHTGGTAKFIEQIMRESGKQLRLFDTFCGMPETEEAWDVHNPGDFSDTSVKQVAEYVGNSDHVTLHAGLIPETFAGRDEPIAFAHLDVDLHRSMADCLENIWPRLVLGGSLVIDDYGQITTPGVRKAVDEFFTGKRSVPLALLTGQVVVTKI